MTRRKLALQFDRDYSRARRKRLDYVLNHPEEAESQDEVDRACRYAEWMTGKVREGLYALDTVMDDDALWDGLHELAARQNETLDELRGAIDRIEAVLVENYKGRCASVELAPKWALLFWHTGGKWGLYTINHKSLIQKLTHAPKHIRLLAVPALEDLLHALQYEDEAA